MILIISFIAIFMSYGLIRIGGKHFRSTFLECIGVVLTFLSSLIFVIFLFMFCIVQITQESDLVSNQELRKSLVYQYENNFYDNDNDLGYKELIDQITEFNSDLARGKKLNQSIWAGNVTSNMYDEIEFIELD